MSTVFPLGLGASPRASCGEDRGSHHDLRRWGLDPAWSRTLPVLSHDGSIRHWHLLDAPPPAPEATVLCVHGNPTWAYTWKPFLKKLSDTYRVVAVDQLGMGYSEEVGPRRFADRVLDLGDIMGHLEIDEEIPLVLAGHDWGGAVAMGWAVGRVTGTGWTWVWRGAPHGWTSL